MIYKLIFIVLIASLTDASLELDCPKETVGGLEAYCAFLSEISITKENYKNLKYTGTEDPLIITHISFNGGKVEKLPSELIQIFPNLDSIVVDEYCELGGQIDEDYVNDLAPLKKFHVRECEVTKISEEAFEKLVNVEDLSLSRNELVTLPENVFQHNVNLKEIKLEKNRLNHLEPNTLKYNTKLEKIDLSHNKLRSIDENLFATLINLEAVELGYNKLETLFANIFTNNPSLGSISLSRNKIKSLSPDTFKNQEKLVILYFKKNICFSDNILGAELDLLKPCYDNWH
jgi:Leucine-rich repeat (LRR) protein